MKLPKKASKKKHEETPPGGKALERLHQFEEERGLEKTDVEHPQPEKPAASEEAAAEGSAEKPPRKP
ncbi:MAG TPA: hypothetical protein VMU89_10435 [Thermomicrobiaceae bacterium]|nr:hypothetical protein [Thermomicrobiaceae bacterium]